MNIMYETSKAFENADNYQDRIVAFVDVISDKTTGVQHIEMIVIILVKCAAISQLSPVQCAIMTIDFF